jgi:antibiotic biosynthesis monooxygenase (ABM) superfamily enzyme
MDEQFEIVIYRLKADVNRDQFMEISDQATGWLRNRPGYLGRELLEDDSGQWVDLVRWATMEDALAAASAFMEVPQATAFIAAVEPESITMLHPRRVVRYE